GRGDRPRSAEPRDRWGVGAHDLPAAGRGGGDRRRGARGALQATQRSRKRARNSEGAQVRDAAGTIRRRAREDPGGAGESLSPNSREVIAELIKNADRKSV